MKNIKKYIILITVFIIILIVALIILLQYMKGDDRNLKGEIFDEGYGTIEEINKKYRKLTSANDYFRIKKIIDRYYANIATINGQTEQIIEYEVEGEEYPEGGVNVQGYAQKEKEQTKKAILAMLGKEYVQEYQITIDNLEEKVKKNKIEEVLLEEIYEVDNSENVTSYYISGKELGIQTTSDFKMLIIIDNKNQTFSIYLEDYMKAHQLDNYQENQEINNPIENIANREYNRSEYESVLDNEIAKEYYNNYKKLLQYNTNLLYEKLDVKYREKKFGDINYFNQYINNMKERLQKRNIIQYYKVNYEGYNQYVCKEQTEQMIIFNSNSLTNYSIILDTYTIDLPEFTEKYEKETDENKVLMNIEKVFTAINDGDYQYVYNKLDNTYKANNFSTLQAFETYIKQNFFEQNKLTAGKAEKQGNIYMYQINITDSTGKNTSSITKTFVMQLKEGTDFVMSFQVD